MKKVLAIVLAAILTLSLGAMAFAAPGDIGTVKTTNRVSTFTGIGDLVKPGTTLYLETEIVDEADAKLILVRANFLSNGSLVAVTPYLVKKTIEEEEETFDRYFVEIKVKSSYSVDKKDVIADIDLKDKNDGSVVEDYPFDITVGYELLAADELMAYTNDIPVVDFTDADFNFTMYWGNLSYPDAILNGKVRSEKPAKKYMGYSLSDNAAIVDANPNAGDMTFISFVATPDFDYKFDLSLKSSIEKGFLYEIGADNKLTKLDYTYEKIEGNDFYTIKGLYKLGAYVVSEKELTGAASTAGKTNPETGANDMINVAVTMAVVSLAAAAAVAFKKR